MADFLDLESLDEVEAPICSGSFLFGCELNSSARSYTFKVSEEDDSDHILALNTPSVNTVSVMAGASVIERLCHRSLLIAEAPAITQHSSEEINAVLSMKRGLVMDRGRDFQSVSSPVCLSEGAKDECNIVEIVGRDYQNQEIAVPVANLKLSCQPWLNLDDFTLRPPVTFSLRSGSGPVHLAGQHQILHRKDLSDDEFSEEEEDLSEDDEFSEEEDLSPIKPAKKQRKS